MFGTFLSLFGGLDSRRLFLCVFVDSGPLQVPIGSQMDPSGASLDLKLGRISEHLSVWVPRWVRDAPRVIFGFFWEALGVFWWYFECVLGALLDFMFAISDAIVENML